MRTTWLLLYLALGGCATTADPCPALEPLPNPATRADQNTWISQAVTQYGECAAAYHRTHAGKE